MNFTDEELRSFRDAYAIDLGDTLTADEARDMLTRLALLYERLAQPLPEQPRVRYDAQ